jgi:hypothetical protein
MTGRSLVHRVATLSVLFAAALGAQAYAAAGVARATGGVTGIVYDSLARTPLRAAVVQLVSDDPENAVVRTAVTDSIGRFSIDSVPDGRYTIGFLHDRLDSLGIEPPLRSVVVRRERAARVALAIPSPARLRDAVCGTPPAPVRDDSAAVVIGFVRDAQTRAPLGRVRVTLRWLQVSFARSGTTRALAQMTAVTGDDGWFALCNAPAGGIASLVAARGADSTIALDVQIPADGVLQRDVFVALRAASTVAARTPPSDAMAPFSDAVRQPRRGGGILRGRITTSDSGRGIPNAWVSLRDGPVTRTNERGEWVLIRAPEGTGMLEVRAIGFYPLQRPVDVVPGAAAVAVTLATFKSVLDTVNIRAKRTVDARYADFNFRRRSSGAGRFLTEADIERRAPLFFSDVFRTVNGITLESTPAGNMLMNRSMVGTGRCAPDVFLNTMWLGKITAEEIDAIVTPREVYGMELYPGGTEPPQFQRAMGRQWSCGSVVIWSKR